MGLKHIFQCDPSQRANKIVEILCTYFEGASKINFISRLSSLVWSFAAMYNAHLLFLKIVIFEVS